jgi:hypothetical protein
MRQGLGFIGATLLLYGYIPYFRHIWIGKTRPHAFSWLIWFLLAAIGFTAQISNGGGAGSLVSGSGAAAGFVILVMATLRGERRIVPLDWFFLAGALVALAAWVLSHSPLISVILISVIEVLAFAPTFRKAFARPHEETVVTFGLSTLACLLGIAGLGQITIITALYLATAVVMNGGLVGMLLVQRHRLVL